MRMQLGLALAACLAAGAAQARTLKVEMKVLPAHGGQGRLRVWLPLPSSNALQTVSELSWDKRWKGVLKTEGEYGNRYLFLESKRPPKEPLAVRFKVKRHEAGEGRRDQAGPRNERFLEPDLLVPLDGPVAMEAEKARGPGAAGLPRALYDRVVGSMRYDKSAPGWGRGDALRACDLRSGNCTDFHSLFIGMARASRIPSRFVMGFSVPKAKAGEIPGYHCWAEFWDGGRSSWIPVDASEAFKQPKKKDYFFGQLDHDRFEISRGRDVLLSPAPISGRQNYLLNPIVELDGVQQQVPLTLAYEELS
jgi:transglutaminase-like putative cysteine protease